MTSDELEQSRKILSRLLENVDILTADGISIQTLKKTAGDSLLTIEELARFEQAMKIKLQERGVTYPH